MRLLTLAIAAICSASVSQAAVVTIFDETPTYGYVSSITYDDDFVAAERGRGNMRHIAANAFDAADGSFFEIGLQGHVDFHFDPGFISGGSIYEVTFGTRRTWPEFATVYVGNAGDEGSFVEINDNPISNQSETVSFTFEGGPFDTIRLKNADGSRVSTCTFRSEPYDCGGFDVDAIAVTAVPLPASVLLLGAGLGGLALMRRARRG